MMTTANDFGYRFYTPFNQDSLFDAAHTEPDYSFQQESPRTRLTSKMH